MSSHHGDEAKDEAAEEIEHHVEILLILHQRWTFVHEGGEGGETAAEAGDQEDVHRRWDDMGLFGQSEENTDHETADNIDGERTPRERRNRNDMGQFSRQKAQACADKTA